MTTSPTPEARIELAVLSACSFVLRGLSGDGSTAASVTAAEFAKRGFDPPTESELGQASRAAKWFMGESEKRERTVQQAVRYALSDRGNGH